LPPTRQFQESECSEDDRERGDPERAKKEAFPWLPTLEEEYVERKDLARI
jgi:hypothetical protein